MQKIDFIIMIFMLFGMRDLG